MHAEAFLHHFSKLETLVTTVLKAGIQGLKTVVKEISKGANERETMRKLKSNGRDTDESLH